jgi:hypothetical protein
MTLFIVDFCESMAILSVQSGYGWRDLDAARAQLIEVHKLEKTLKIYEVTINAKEIE